MKKTIQTVFVTISALVIVFVAATHFVTREMTTNLPRIPFPYTKVKPLHCPSLAFSKENLPITALASFPGCGNTWVRHLIQSMTGIVTGSMYTDKSLQRSGFPGEGITDGSVIVVKTHAYHPNRGSLKNVLVMRNPYSALMAEFNRRRSKSHILTVKIDDFIKSFSGFLNISLGNYRYFYVNWEKAKNLHLVMFDDLVGNLENELTRLLKYLQNSTSIVGNVQCALGNSTGGHKRDKSKLPPTEFLFTREKIRKVNKVIDDLYNIYTKRFKEQAELIKLWKLPEE